MATTVTSKGQVTIPKDIRDHLNIRAGNSVEFVAHDDGKVRIVKADDKGISAALQKWRGSAGPGLSTDEVMAMTRGEA